MLPQLGFGVGATDAEVEGALSVGALAVGVLLLSGAVLSSADALASGVGRSLDTALSLGAALLLGGRLSLGGRPALGGTLGIAPLDALSSDAGTESSGLGSTPSGVFEGASVSVVVSGEFVAGPLESEGGAPAEGSLLDVQLATPNADKSIAATQEQMDKA